MKKPQTHGDRISAGLIASLLGVGVFLILTFVGAIILSTGIAGDVEDLSFWMLPATGLGVVLSFGAVVGLFWCIGRVLEAVGVRWDD